MYVIIHLNVYKLINTMCIFIYFNLKILRAFEPQIPSFCM